LDRKDKNGPADDLGVARHLAARRKRKERVALCAAHSKILVTLLAKKKAKSWLHRYRLLFVEDLGIDWSKGPVSFSELEQLNLTRDDVVHNVDVLSMNVGRTENHAERFPVGLFTDELWAKLGVERVKVDKEKLRLAIEVVEKFCTWIDGVRCSHPKHISGAEEKA
jgi:hypothetical protein